MASLDPAWTDIWQTIFLGGQLLLLLVAAIFGWRQLRQAEELREAQTRPFVVIDLDEGRRPKVFDLVVKNIGATMARDVKFEFDEPPETTMPEASLDRLKMFREGISTLPPAKEIRVSFDMGPARYGAKLPDVYEVAVTYRAATGGKPYREVMDLDFGLSWNRVSVEVHGLHDIHTELEGIREAIQKLTPGRG